VQGQESITEKRYRKLLLGMDLTQDFFFSYTYNIAATLQTNMASPTQQDRFDSMFVWNDHLTRCGHVFLLRYAAQPEMLSQLPAGRWTF